MTMDEVKFWQKGCQDTLDAIEQEGLYRCPKCKKLMNGAPCDWNICSHCHIEFGYGAEHYYDEKPLWSPIIGKP